MRLLTHNMLACNAKVSENVQILVSRGENVVCYGGRAGGVAERVCVAFVASGLRVGLRSRILAFSKNQNLQ